MIQTLVVEDNPDVQTLIEDLLATYPWDFKIRMTDKGAEAIQMAQQHPPDLMLLDIQLADKVDGYEVARQMRANPATTHTKIVILSALDAPVDEHLGKKAGADTYITKPIQNRILFVALQELLG